MIPRWKTPEEILALARSKGTLTPKQRHKRAAAAAAPKITG